jgi:hypothetical protein
MKTLRADKNEIVKWKPIDGFPGYEVNLAGGIRKTYEKSGKIHIMTSYPKGGKARKGSTYYVVKLKSPERGKYIEVKTAHIVARAFLAPPKDPDYVLWHKNGMQEDNFANNLEWISREELGKRTGA